ncbi:MAG: outer membrane beta-barrel protein [Saprospiraceae bacterium]|nr:outer membrane beta-barrel protein [Saprospiraceae bacterium]
MIKRFLQIVLILVSTSYFSVAQLGVRAGLNFSSMKFEVIGLNADTDSKVGAHFGVVNDFMLSDAITFRPGVLFSLKGGKSDEETISTSYIEVPLFYL